MLNNRKTIIEFFNNITDEYFDVYSKDSKDPVRRYIFLSRKENVLDFAKGIDGYILDIGSGPAVFTKELLGDRKSIFNVDISEEMVKKGVRWLKENNIYGPLNAVGDIENMFFKKAVFDLIISSGVIEYVNNPFGSVSEMARIAKKDGYLIITAPNSLCLANIIDRFLMRIYRLILKTLRFFSKKENFSLSFRKDIKIYHINPLRLNRQLKKEQFFVENYLYHGARIIFLNKIAPGFVIKIDKFLKPFRRGMLGMLFCANYIVKARKI